MDPSMEDSDLDGIPDGQEDPDRDGLNRSGLVKKYCPGYDDPTNSQCHINPDTPDGVRFYDNLENYTNFEEFQNGTDPVTNDTDGDEWNDGPEVYYQDHDNDGMATGWEYHFEFDPYDAADRMVDTTVTATSTIVNTSGTRTQGTPCRSPVRVNCATRSLSEQAAS